MWPELVSVFEWFSKSFTQLTSVFNAKVSTRVECSHVDAPNEEMDETIIMAKNGDFASRTENCISQ